jgi:hypothetical protein
MTGKFAVLDIASMNKVTAPGKGHKHCTVSPR